MEVVCSFCESSFLQSNHVVSKGKYVICRECITIIKEVFEEFSKTETYESGGICSFCGNTHSISNKVFQGKKVNICNLCFNIIEDELMELSIQPKKSRKSKQRENDLIFALVRPEIKKLKAYSVPDLKCRVKLDGNESPFPLPDNIKRRIREDSDKIEINRYPESGAIELKKSISTVTGIDINRIILGNGSDELIEMIIRSFAGGTGKIMVPTPTFSMYRISAVTLGYEAVEVELDNEFDLDTNNLREKIESVDPDIIFLASPNNPTGNVFSNDRIIELLEYAGHNRIVVLDEAYFNFSGVSYIDRLDKYKNLIILRTLSKIGFAALRLGILFASKDICETINKVRLPYNINSFTQCFAKIAFEEQEMVNTNCRIIVKERQKVFDRIKLIPGVEVFKSDANFILMRVEDAERVFKQLVDKGILVRIFNSPPRLKNCLRVTIGTRQENDTFLKALSAAISS